QITARWLRAPALARRLEDTWITDAFQQMLELGGFLNLAWILNVVSLFAMTAGSLLFFAGLWEAPRYADDGRTPERRRSHIKSRRTLAIVGGVLSLWFLIQYLGLILL
ncbi:MAG: hypothetical protein ACYC7B_14725, partial [Burkholderiales bacterium]